MDATIEESFIYDITQNQKIINDYFEARRTETNLAGSTQIVINNTLNRLSRYANKNFNDVTREDIISFLNTLRKNETDDPNHKWIGTYNLYLMTIDTFFKWLYYPKTEPKERPKPEVLLNVKRLKRKEKSAYKPTDMWTQEDDLLFLKYRPSKRDRCYHAISRDSSCRPHELLKLKIKDVVFKMASDGHRQYAEILVNGKTGTRAIPLINSIPYVKDMLDSHPMKNSPNEHLIYNEKAFGRALSIFGLFHMYKRYRVLVFPSLLKDPLLDPDDKAKIQDLLKKPWNPYIRRHSALTEKSKFLKEHTLRQHAGWSPTSNMHQKYIHYFGNESNESILEAYGLISKSKQYIDKLKPKACPNCQESNKIDAKFCSKCRMVLSYDAYTQVIEENESEKQSEITKLRSEFDEMKATMKDMTDLMRLKLESDKEEDYIKYLKQNNQIKSIDKRLSEKGLEEHKHLVRESFLSKMKRERMNSKIKNKK
jgi:integrase/recombinase XerD